MCYSGEDSAKVYDASHMTRKEACHDIQMCLAWIDKK
jgi:hypothetical protein